MILDEIIKAVRLRVDKDKAKISYLEIKTQAERLIRNFDFPFERALEGNDIKFICEVKKASPSKGIIVADFPYVTIAKEYEEAGAACISVLTEMDYFKGRDSYLTEIKKEVNIPILRKDFIIDPYQIYQSKVIGADCVLLICSLLNKDTLIKYLEICERLGLSALVEAHSEEEVQMALSAKARMIGVNNRDLRTFRVDIQNSVRLRSLVPDNIIFIAESGIKTVEDIRILRNGKVNGVLIGETLMTAKDKKAMLYQLSNL